MSWGLIFALTLMLFSLRFIFLIRDYRCGCRFYSAGPDLFRALSAGGYLRADCITGGTTVP